MLIVKELKDKGIFVGRAALKLEPFIVLTKINFRDKKVLDIGSSTGGFTQLALLKGASNVFAVELGTNQMDKVLRKDQRIELHEKTDILDVSLIGGRGRALIPYTPDIIMMDVSFVSLRKILPHVKTLSNKDTQIIALVKPQFEADSRELFNGIIKNENIRRKILKDFESWSKPKFKIVYKSDSSVKGSKGNQERLYLLKIL